MSKTKITKPKRPKAVKLPAKPRKPTKPEQYIERSGYNTQIREYDSQDLKSIIDNLYDAYGEEIDLETVTLSVEKEHDDPYSEYESAYLEITCSKPFTQENHRYETDLKRYINNLKKYEQKLAKYNQAVESQEYQDYLVAMEVYQNEIELYELEIKKKELEKSRKEIEQLEQRLL